MVVLLVMLIGGGMLVQRGAEQRKVARTALLFQAVDRADWAQVRQLLEKGVDVNAKGDMVVTPLVRAIIKSNSGDKASLDTVNSILEHDADVNAHTEFGVTPLHYANNPVIVSLLLSRGAGVDKRDKNGATPLFSAACDSPEKVNQLIASHADVNVQTNSGDTPLHNAASCGSLPAVKALIDHGARVNVRNQHGKTPLALSLRNPEIGAYLEAHGATGEILLQLPTATGAVNDFAGVISIDVANRMSRISTEILRKTGTAVVVATVKDVGNITPDTYATELFNTWGIGNKGENKGVLIFLTMKPGNVSIRTGYGVERILPSRLCGEILDQHVIPYLKNNDYNTGLGNAIAAVAQVIAKDAGITLKED